MDASLKKTLQEIPLHRTNAGPRDGDKWVTRLKEEYNALIEVSESALVCACVCCLLPIVLDTRKSKLCVNREMNR